MKTQRFSNIWDAIADTPAEAENLKLRSQLMMELEQHIVREKITQEEASKRLGVSRPRVSDLVRGHILSLIHISEPTRPY